MKAINVKFDWTKKDLEVLTAACAAEKEHKYNIAMLYIYNDVARKKLVATNGKVLAVLDIPVELEASGELEGVKYMTYKNGVLLEVSCNSEFPDWWRCVSDAEPIDFPRTTKKERNKRGKAQGVRNMSVICAGTGKTFDFSYSKCFEFDIEKWLPFAEQGRPCQAMGHGLTVLIMPYGSNMYQDTQEQFKAVSTKTKTA